MKIVKPVTFTYDCHMPGIYHTTREAMKGFVQRMMSLEGCNKKKARRMLSSIVR